ncbi:glycoside hydrolase [Podospora fimiseda]|uniref:alpha-1,2-Mannosidase n=1 Tax=Podospora fimiseda TaxID=252190 RepID=A0AAN7H924_9PEZI|nr:glycoside hydrolase [Podospora fimiseda]
MQILGAGGVAAVALVGLASHAVMVSTAPAGSEQQSRPPYIVNKHRARAVQDAFRVSWDGYYQYAFPHDSLKPIAKSWEDDRYVFCLLFLFRNGWGASAVDAFSTALIMGNWEAVDQLLNYIPTIDFSKTNTEVSLFETTIRYLGGLLSAYDLITGPLSGYIPRNRTTQVYYILVQAKFLADNLKVAFDTPSGIPDNNLYFNPPRRAGSRTNGIATIGTLVLEWTRLSDLTGDQQYARLAQRAEEYLLHPRPALGEPFPGLLGANVDLGTGLFVDGAGGWGGGTDSFYEYLIKMYLYDPYRFSEYRDRWVLAADSSMKYLISHPTSRPDLTFLAMWRNRTLEFYSEHLACFSGGNFILGGLTLSDPSYVKFGLELVNGCRATYKNTETGIGPEIFRWQDGRTPLNSSNNPGPPVNESGFYEKSGFWVANGGYVLRPEVIESYYYAYRATGDKKYQEWAWEAFKAINESCRVGVGYSGILDVNRERGGGYRDFQESFWFAEVLKYSFLIFAEDDAPWQVRADGKNEFVFNTEAHPIRVAKGGRRPYSGKWK